MHKLDRSVTAAPDCLSGFDYRIQTWDDLGTTCKKQVRCALFQVQGIVGITSDDAAEYGLRCAYCEGAIRHEGHIEHFRRKSKCHPNGYPELTFEWSNLFIACGSKEHCGHYKDRPSAPGYDAEQLVKADELDPELYLYFHSSGEVRERQKLSDGDRRRAIETIRVFGLDNRSLAGARARAVSQYRRMNTEDFEVLASWSEADRQEYFLSEIEATRWHPYSTTLKHFLQSDT